MSYGAHEVRDGVSVTRNTKVRPLAMASEIQHMKILNFYLKMVDSPIIKKSIKYKKRKVIEPKSFVLVEEDDAEKNYDTKEKEKKVISKNTGGNISKDIHCITEDANNLDTAQNREQDKPDITYKLTRKH